MAYVDFSHVIPQSLSHFSLSAGRVALVSKLHQHSSFLTVHWHPRHPPASRWACAGRAIIEQGQIWWYISRAGLEFRLQPMDWKSRSNQWSLTAAKRNVHSISKWVHACLHEIPLGLKSVEIHWMEARIHSVTIRCLPQANKCLRRNV